YPTSELLSRASLSDLVKIPHVTEKKATAILQAARQSVASSRAFVTEFLVGTLAAEILRQEALIKKLREQLLSLYTDDPCVALYKSIPGIGEATAVALRLYLGDCGHFRTPEALVAFCGLDPKLHHSGDVKSNLRISKRGPSRVRALLY